MLPQLPSQHQTAILPSLRLDFTPEQQAAWFRRHEECVARARAGPIEILFLGDSLTQGWLTHGRAQWDEYFAPRGAANFGVAGDRTQQVLWRILNGELDGINPKAIVLLIGTNNMTPGLGTKNPTPRNTPEEIVAGISAVLETLRQKLPPARILLFGIFPRGGKDDPLRSEIAAINTALRGLEELPAVRFADIGTDFLAPDGSIPPEIMPDLLHLRAPGYQRWAARLAPLLDTMLST